MYMSKKYLLGAEGEKRLIRVSRLLYLVIPCHDDPLSELIVEGGVPPPIVDHQDVTPLVVGERPHNIRCTEASTSA